MKDPRDILASPKVYELFSRLVGGKRARETLVRTHVRPWAGARVLDLGCGPGELFRHLGDVRYVGIDVSEEYIAQAKRSFGDRAEFRMGNATKLDPDLREFDLVLAFGVLHHLDDEHAQHLFREAREALDHGGRLVTLDATLAPEENRVVARLMISHDRGKHVRTPDAYQRLAEATFAEVRCAVHRNLLRIPYAHCVLECRGDAGLSRT